MASSDFIVVVVFVWFGRVQSTWLAGKGEEKDSKLALNQARIQVPCEVDAESCVRPDLRVIDFV